MENRTVIEALADGNVAVTREAPRGIPGTSRDRRKAKKRPAKSAWRKIERKVFRNTSDAVWYANAGVVIAKCDAEIEQQAADNQAVADWYTLGAAQTVEEIDDRNAAFSVAAPRKVRVTITYEE